MKQDLHDRIDRDFTNIPPVDETIVARFEEIREYAKSLGHVIVDLTPASREQSLALTALEQTVMYAVASIARNQDGLV